MTVKQKAHVARIIKAFEFKMSHKYVQGAKTHGGNLWERDDLYLLDAAIDETIDQFVYLMTLRDSITQVK